VAVEVAAAAAAAVAEKMLGPLAVVLTMDPEQMALEAALEEAQTLAATQAEA